MQSNSNLTIPTKELVIDKQTILGKGGCAIVYLGQYNSMNVAVKMAQASDTSSLASAHHALRTELNILNKINKTWNSSKVTTVVGVMKYYGSTRDENNSLALVMEYANSGCLGDWVYSFSDKKPYNKPFSWELGYPVILDMAKGLYWLHTFNFIHGDVKVDNVLLNEENGKLSGKICDFGFTQEVKKVNYFIGGTILCQAPETLLYSRVSQKSDIYSFSCALFEMTINDQVYSHYCDASEISDEQDFLKDHVATKDFRDNIPEDTPKKIAHLITWGWKKEPKERPTAIQLIEHLRTPIDEIAPELELYPVKKYS